MVNRTTETGFVSKFRASIRDSTPRPSGFGLYAMRRPYALCDFYPIGQESEMEGHIHIHWNWIVAIDLFAAGLSAGAFIMSATAYFLGKQRYEPITRIGAYIAPFPVIVGIVCLIFDLERPHLFWKLFLTFQPNSVMSLGSWLLFAFSIFSASPFLLLAPGAVRLFEDHPEN